MSRPDPSRGLLPPSATATGTMRVLLETAVVQFAHRGYDGVSVRDITTDVGIKPSSLYAHYPSKEHLLYDLMRLGHEEGLRAGGAALAELGDDPTPTERLAAIVRSQVRLHAEYPMLARVCVNELHGLSGESLRSILSLRMDGLGVLLGILHDGVAAGDFAVDDVFLAGMAIGGMIYRVSAWYGGNESGLEFGPVLPREATPAAQYPVDRVCDAYAALVLRMVT